MAKDETMLRGILSPYGNLASVKALRPAPHCACVAWTTHALRYPSLHLGTW